MVFEARIERDWSLICSGNFERCHQDALNNGFKVEGYVIKGLLLYNPSRDAWATITTGSANDLTSTLSRGINDWYFFEYPTRPRMNDPAEYMLRDF